MSVSFFSLMGIPNAQQSLRRNNGSTTLYGKGCESTWPLYIEEKGGRLPSGAVRYMRI